MSRQRRVRKRAGPLYQDTSQPVLDDRKVMIKVDEFAGARDVDGLRKLIDQVIAFDPDRGEILIQGIKFRHPEMYRLLRKEEGRGYDSFTDSVIDEAYTPGAPSLAQSKDVRRGKLRRGYEEYDHPRGLSVEDLEGDLNTEVYLSDEDLNTPVAIDDYVVEFDENEIEPRHLHELEVEEGKEMPARELHELLAERRRKRASGLADRERFLTRRRRVAEDPEEEEPMFFEEEEEMGGPLGEELDFEELDLEGLDLDGLDLDDEDLEGMEGEEEGESCPPGQTLKCVPEDEEEAEEAKEDEEEEAEEEEGKEDEPEDEEEEAEEDEEGVAASAEEDAPDGTTAEAEPEGYLVERLYNDHDLMDLKDAHWDVIPFGIRDGKATIEDPHYALFANGHPVASVHFSDQNLQGHDYMFTRPSYAERIKEGFKNWGVTETFRQINARYYSATALQGDVARHVEAKVREGLEAERREKLAELKDNFLNTAALVIEGSIKNYWGENPLKETLHQAFTSVGADENTAIGLIEGAWREAASEYFEVVLNKADELMGAHPEVLKHHASEIAAMQWRHPGYATDEPSIPVAAGAPQPQPRRGFSSVPIATGPSQAGFEIEQPAYQSPREAQRTDAAEKRAMWKEQLGLSNRLVHAASSANYENLQRQWKRQK